MAFLKVQLPKFIETYDGRLLRDMVRQLEDLFSRVKNDIGAAETPVSGDYTVTAQDTLICADTTVGNVQVSLPEINPGLILERFEVTVKKCTAPNKLSIVPTGGATIDGYNGVDVFVLNTALQFRAVSSGWRIV